MENKFGMSTLVVNDIITQTKNVKNVISDKNFVDLVEKLEIFRQALESLGQSLEMANLLEIGEIESRLPLGVSMDWCKIFVEENIENLFSMVRYR